MYSCLFLVIEDLFKLRQKYPKVEAVYLITPNEKSIAALISDFAIRGKPMYKTAHVYLLMSKLFLYCYFFKRYVKCRRIRFTNNYQVIII